MADSRLSGRSQRLVPLVVLTLCAGLALLHAPDRADARKADPFAGDGSWVWYVSASGGSPRVLAKRAKRYGLETVYIKSSDGRHVWSQFTRGLVRALHRRGINACAWSFVYGDDPGREARASARAEELGADCLVIDAESSYEGRYKEAYKYMRKLRKRVGGGFPLGLSSFPYVDYHPSLPYSVFMGRGGVAANLPQVYWKAIGTTVRRSMDHTYKWNRAYGTSIYPVGQTWQNPAKKQLLDFRKYTRGYGSTGLSWWSWQETNKREWRLLERRLNRGVPGFEDQQDYPRLTKGASGDLVLLAQELLRSWDAVTQRNGRFNSKLRADVRDFQKARGLRVSGRIGDATWRVLTRRKPDSTKWKRRPVPPRLLRARPARSSAPQRAPLLGEVPPTRGRP